MKNLMCKIFGCKQSDFEVIRVYETKTKNQVIKNNLVVSIVCKRCGKVLSSDYKYNLSLKEIANELK